MDYKNHWLREKQKKSLPEIIQMPEFIMVSVSDKIEMKTPPIAIWDFETEINKILMAVEIKNA